MQHWVPMTDGIPNFSNLLTLVLNKLTHNEKKNSKV